MRENDNNEIDGYQRKILRWMLGIRWPAKLSDEEVYRRTGLTPWSTQITTRRLRWFGHANRLNPETPASRALNDTINTDTKKPRGGQRMTWMKCLQKDLNKANITLNQALDVSQDRAAWRQIVHKMRWSRSNQDVWTDDICISQVSQVPLSIKPRLHQSISSSHHFGIALYP